MGAERKDLEAIGVTRDDVERALPDRAGGAQDGQAPGADSAMCDVFQIESRGGFDATQAASQTEASATMGSVEVRLSMRSRMPPWPGRMLHCP